MRLCMVHLGVAIACAALGAAQKEDLNAQLKDLAKKRYTAFSQKDTAALNRICVNDFKLITPAGIEYDLQATKARIEEATAQSRFFTLVSFQAYVADDESMAFSVSEAREESVIENKTIVSDYLVTEVYVKRKGHWKIQLLHLSQKTCNFPG